MPALTRDSVSGEALFILKNLRENTRLGRSNKLGDVKSALEPAVSLEFDTYFFFLRKFHYIAMDREAQLKLTDTGERVVEGEHIDRFAGEVGEFFADQLMPPDESTQASAPVEELVPPPPPFLEESEVVPPRKKLTPQLPYEEPPVAVSPGNPNFTARVEVPDLRREHPFPAPPPPTSYRQPQNVLAQPPQRAWRWWMKAGDGSPGGWRGWRGSTSTRTPGFTRTTAQAWSACADTGAGDR